MELKAEIERLKRERNAIILAHYYQEADIQDVADYVGDSLGLSQEAARTQADVIVFAGVHFMAETAKILNPEKRVILPDLEAGCSLAESCEAEAFKAFRALHPDHLAVTYVNCSAEVKAESDIVCTSANAVKIVNSIPKHQKILFAPDKNLGAYVSKVTGRDMLLWDGVCTVHDNLSKAKLEALISKYPEAVVVAHPESHPDVLSLSDFTGSTSEMIRYITDSDKTTFIIGTEVGLLHQLKSLAKDKTLIPAPSHEHNACACSECPYMKKNTLQKLYDALKTLQPEISLEASLCERAKLPLERMFALS
jgi:quinolinate synthase